jgi:hypothetical protein
MQGPHVDDQIVVPQTPYLGHRMGHVPGGDELPLLEVDGPAAAGRCSQEVRLPAEEGWDLQHIEDFGRRLNLACLVDIGENRYAIVAADAGKDGKALLQPRPPEGIQGGAVGLVKGGLENKGDGEPFADLLQGGGDLPGQRCRLENTGTGDEKERLPRPYGEGFSAAGPAD